MHTRSTISKSSTAVTLSSLARLMVYEFHQDDPRKCTSAKLRRFRLVRLLSNLKQIPTSSIVLDPTASKTLTSADCVLVEQSGIVALDCSWNLSDSVFDRRLPGETRRLPTLLAGNPTNYGVPGKLSTAEALAAALYITGFTSDARKVLSLFKWGETFLSLNQEPLEAYSKARPEAMAHEEREFFNT